MPLQFVTQQTIFPPDQVGEQGVEKTCEFETEVLSASAVVQSLEVDAGGEFTINALTLGVSNVRLRQDTVTYDVNWLWDDGHGNNVGATVQTLVIAEVAEAQAQ
jgi:hypothetical protein